MTAAVPVTAAPGHRLHVPLIGASAVLTRRLPALFTMLTATVMPLVSGVGAPT